MPTFTTPMHTLLEVCKQIPDEEDCYLIECVDADGSSDSDGLLPVPWTAQRVLVLVDAWSHGTWGNELDQEEERREWEERWGWDGKPEHDRVRLDHNTPTVRHPIMMTFQWGEGHPKKDGVEMIPHEEGEWGHYCAHCQKEYTGYPEDCPVLRLRAMADAVLQGTAGVHVKAVRAFHMPEEEQDSE